MARLVFPKPADRGFWPAVALVAANLVPLVGVLLLGWDLGLILMLFWLENGVVGFYSILRLAMIAGWAAVGLVPFFIFHFGGFMAGHLLFLLLFFVVDDPFDASWSEVADVLQLGTPWPAVAVAALLVSHGVSFVRNFLLGDERERLGVQNVMLGAYKRVVVLHLTIIFGGILVKALGQPVAALALLVVLKIGVDLAAHLNEHRRGRHTFLPTPPRKS